MFKFMMMGCLTMVVGGAVAGAGCIIVGKETVNAAMRSQKANEERARKLDRQFPFHPDATGVLKPDGFQKFLKVRASVHNELDDSRKMPDLAWADVLSPVQTVSRVLDSQMAERSKGVYAVLEKEHMGPTEYRWYTRAAFGALAADASGADKAVGNKIQKQLETAGLGQLLKQAPKLMPAGLEVVKKHHAELADEKALLHDGELFTLALPVTD